MLFRSVAESKIEGLKKFYGLDDPRGLAYFKVHIEADREHAATERALLTDSLNQSNSDRALESADRILNALWEMLSGVCRRHQIPC